jgi:hypothetical protein
MVLSFIRDCSVISWAMACADSIWSTVLITGAGGMKEEDLYAGSERGSIVKLCGREKSESLAGRGYTGGLLPCSPGKSSVIEPLNDMLVLGVSGLST